jgi:peptide deformylase
MLITHPHPTLREKALKVKKSDPQLKTVIRTMQEIIKDKGGLGLAANQINFLKRVIIITDSPQDPKKNKYIPYINPKIISHSQETQTAKEGCLSVPNKEVKIKRFKKVTILAEDERGQRIKIKAKDLLARIFQHEIDHLNGKLIIDYEDDKD